VSRQLALWYVVQTALLHMCLLQVCLLAQVVTWMVLMLMWHASLAQGSLHLLLLLLLL
jgi:hypothetical protein